jgi:predicted flap endonuclease-1-like 5' DNA nuclease
MAKSIEALEGIGPVKGKKLRACGCGSETSLLKNGGTRAGRSKIAKASGLSEKVILRCVNMADLFRIKGVATQFAELLEAAGVDTVKELRNRNAANLAEAMQKKNAKKKLTRVVPGEKVLAAWIKQAKKLKPAVSY